MIRRADVEFRYWMSRKIENAFIWTARRLPRELRKWCVVMAACRACGDTKSPGEIGYREMYESA